MFIAFDAQSVLFSSNMNTFTTMFYFEFLAKN